MNHFLRITSNYHRYEPVSWREIDDPATQAAFEYVGDDIDTPRFVKYRGEWYDINEFLCGAAIRSQDGFESWDGFVADTFFSGILVKYMDNYDEGFVQMGRYCT